MTTCPIPRKSQLITAAGPTTLCGEPADVMTVIPMVDQRTGQRYPEFGYTCLHHAISIATWKLVENLKAWERQNPRRIITAG